MENNEVYSEEDDLTAIETPLSSEQEDSVRLRQAESKKPVRDAGEVFSARLLSISQAENQLLEAAAPLLYFLAHPPKQLKQTDLEKLRSTLVHEIKAFIHICQAANIKREHMITAQYSLCTAIDEMIQLSSWGGSDTKEVSQWSKASLLTTFHKENYGGDKFFLLIGRLAAQPALHIDVLELMYIILSLGFEGRYRRDPQGSKQLEAVRNRLHTLIYSEKGQVPKDLAVHWQGISKEQLPNRRTVPVWFFAAVVGVLVLTQFIFYKYSLLETTYRLEENILTIGKINLPKIQQKKLEPLKLSVLLQAEIQKQILAVEEDSEKAVVIFKGDNVFKPASPVIDAAMIPVIKSIAQEMLKVKGQITIEGHSDSTPLRGWKYPDNQALSLARAEAVAAILMANKVGADRIKAIGRGDTMPVGDNATPEGRAKNRRVVISILYE